MFIDLFIVISSARDGCVDNLLIIYGREITLYLCIHDVSLLFTLSSGFKEACGGESTGKEGETFWHSICMLPYWLMGLAEIKRSLYSR